MERAKDDFRQFDERPIPQRSAGIVHFQGRRYDAGRVLAPDKVRALATAAEKAEEIDVLHAETALRKAQEALSDPHVELDAASALDAVFRAEARIEAAAQAKAAKALQR